MREETFVLTIQLERAKRNRVRGIGWVKWRDSEEAAVVYCNEK